MLRKMQNANTICCSTQKSHLLFLYHENLFHAKSDFPRGVYFNLQANSKTRKQ